MDYTPDIRRRSNRLAGFDYSQAGAYFITITVRGRLPLFGDVANGEARLNDAGDMVRRVWESMSERFPSITMDQFVVMPNHVHGIIIIRQLDGGEIGATTRVARTVGDVVGAYKSSTTVEYTWSVRTLNWPPFEKRLWRRNYYEHIVRNEESLNRIRQYIIDNPARWDLDRENPMVAASRDAGP